MQDDKKTLSLLRVKNAEECLSATKTLFKEGNYKSAANRCYYAAFHAMRAVLALDEIDMKHHSGVISEFRRLYIKTDILDSKLSQIISVLFDIRTDSDYDDFFVITKEEVEEMIEKADFFVQTIKQYLNHIIE